MDDIDARLSRLVERHEALTQSVEHLALQGEEQNKRIDKIVGVLETLAQVVQSHERRISGLEGGNGS